MKRRSIEDQLQIGIVYAIKLEFDTENEMVFFHPPNGGKRKQIIGKNGKSYSPEAAKLKAMGVLAGVPDLTFNWPERVPHGECMSWTGRMDTGYIEIKIPKGAGYPAGTLTEHQEKFRDRILAMNGKWALCRSYEEVKATLIGWGVKSKVSN